MSAMRTQRASILVMVASLLLPAGAATLSSGCGDDGASAQKQQTKKQSSRRGRRGGRGKRGAAAKGGKLQTYPKIEEKYRRDFRTSDFRPDKTGEDNRDPFRSYVVKQPGNELEEDKGLSIEPTELCSGENTVATSYSLRELTLIGIVLRGTRAWAQFRDSAGVGHIVRRGDCVGKEKAVVKRIGAGYVRLEVVPEAPPSDPAPEPQSHDIPLYPEELELQESEPTEE